MKFFNLLAVLFISYMFGCLALFLFGNQIYLVDNFSIALLCMLVLTLIILLQTAHILSLYVFQKYVLSILFLLLLLKYGRDWHFAKFSEFTSSELNTSLMHALLGTIIAGMGIHLGTVGLRAKDSAKKFNSFMDRATLAIKPISIFFVYVMIAGVSAYMFFILGTGRHYSATSDSGFNWIKIFRHTSPIFYLVYGILFFGFNELKKSGRWLLTLVLIFMFGNSLFQGSRSFVYMFFMLTIFLKVARDGNFILTKKVLLGFAILILTAIVSYPVGTTLRRAGRDGGFNAKNIVRQWNYVYKGKKQSKAFMDILNRLTELPPSIRIMNDKQVSNLDHYISPSFDFARTVNALVPGDLFKDILPASQLFNYVYLGHETNYNTQEWGIFEYFYVLFDRPFGFLILFISIFILSRVWKFIIFGKIPLKPFITIFFLIWFWRFLQNQGMAFWLSAVITELIVFSFYFVIIRYVVPFWAV